MLIFLAGLAAASLIGLTAMSGLARHFAPVPLTADVRLSELILPNDLLLDQSALTDALLGQIHERTGSDDVLRRSLEAQGCRQPLEALMPRLITPSMISQFVASAEPLATALDLGSYRAVARIEVRNRTNRTLEDVALTLPSVFRVEEAGDRLASVDATASGLHVLRIPRLEAGSSHSMVAWLADSEFEEASLADRIRIGAAPDIRGRVYFFGSSDWFGRDLAIMPWARWLVGGIVAATGLGAAAGLVLIGVGILRGRRSSPA